jgi:hypothetical protein
MCFDVGMLAFCLTKNTKNKKQKLDHRFGSDNFIGDIIESIVVPFDINSIDQTLVLVKCYLIVHECSKPSHHVLYVSNLHVFWFYIVHVVNLFLWWVLHFWWEVIVATPSGPDTIAWRSFMPF